MLCAFILFCLFLFGSRVYVAAYCNDTQESTSTDTDQEKQKTEEQKTEVQNPIIDEPSPEPSERRRIVDPDNFPPKSPLPARIILAPFRKIGPVINEGVTFAEKSFFNHQRFAQPGASKGFSINPIFGGLGDGTGIGGGVYLSSGNAISRNFTLFGSAQGTTQKYLESTFGFLADPTGGGGRFFSIDLKSRYRYRPEEDFWGLGPQSFKGQRSTYNLQERGVNLRVMFHLPFHLNVGAGIDYSSNSVFNGKDQRFAEIKEVFGESGLPGLVEGGAAILGTYAFAEFDARDKVFYPRSGAYVHFSVTNNDSVGRGDFGYVNYLLDGRGYIPLGSKKRVLALRFIGNFNDRKGGSEIPFFRLARLGDQYVLRGYGTYRFHGENSIASSIEYRYRLGRWIDTFLFTDVGQVFDRVSQINNKNLHATFGGGIQFRSEDKVYFKIYFGKSGEGARVYFTFGPTF
jgi:hypothetical protein